MEIIQQFENPLNDKKPSVLTIGNFDGLHRGHQAVLARLKEVAFQNNRKATVLTFSNTPADILRPTQQLSQLYSLEHKIALLKEMGIDRLILLPFTQDLSQLSAEEFLQRLYSSFPFDHLVLGYDAAFGREREGDREKIIQLGSILSMKFQVEYLKPFIFDGEVVSSSQIRLLIQQGNLKQTERLLGRKYSIYSKITHGAGKGKQLGFPTANIALKGFCLPPFGIYAVMVKIGKNSFQGAANLGLAPTLRNSPDPLLEVYLFDYAEDLYDQSIEVIFYEYIRPEIKFPTLDALKIQIQKDVEAIKDLWDW